MRMKHPIRGLLIGALAAVVGYWIGTMALASMSSVRVGGVQALRELAVIVSFGTPVACAAAFLWGAPALYLLHRVGWLRASTVVFTGALGGAIVAVWLEFLQQGALFQVRISVPAGAALGALAGGICWWAGAGRSQP